MPSRQLCDCLHNAVVVAGGVVMDDRLLHALGRGRRKALVNRQVKAGLGLLPGVGNGGRRVVTGDGGDGYGDLPLGVLQGDEVFARRHRPARGHWHGPEARGVGVDFADARGHGGSDELNGGNAIGAAPA